MGLLDWVLGREPVATAVGIAAVVTAGLGVAAAFGAPVTETQIAAIGALVTALAGWLGRSAVTPVAKLTAPRTDYGALDAQAELDRAERVRTDPDNGGVPLALLIAGGAIVIMLLGLGLCGDALFEDEDEVNDLGAPIAVELVSHDYCAADHDGDCGGGDWGGPGSDGNSGGRYEGGRGGGDYDGDGDGPRCRNFCFYGVPAPGEDGGNPAPSAAPSSLFPPSPDAVRAFVVSTIRGGLDLGRLFTEAVYKFVENLLVGIA